MCDLELRSALVALVNKLDQIINDKSFTDVFAMASFHGFSYTGPTFEKELADAKRLLEKDSI